jgi:hypothetical protein
VAPGPKKPKKAPVSRPKSVKNESSAVEARIVDTKNIKGEFHQPGNDMGKQEETVAGKDEGSVDGQGEDQENPVGDLLDSAAEAENADFDSESSSDVYA